MDANNLMTLAEVGRVLGISKQSVDRIESEAMEKIREGILADPVLKEVALEMSQGQYQPLGESERYGCD